MITLEVQEHFNSIQVLHLRRLTSVGQVALALLVLLVGTAIAIYNVHGLVHNPSLGINYVLLRRAELIHEIEGVAQFSKQELINLDRGDGMRFLAFIRQNIPEHSTLVFPVEQFDAKQRESILGPVPLTHFVVTLYPRRIQRDSYDFRRLPYAESDWPDLQKRFRVASRDYSHSSKHFVFHIFVSPEGTRYRFFTTTARVTGQNYHTEIVFVLWPNGNQP